MSVVINGTSGISGVDGSAGTPAVQGTDTNTGMFFPTTDTIAFAEGGVEAMRIDSSGNVGIGTSSPSYNLHVKNGAGNCYSAVQYGSGTIGYMVAASNEVQFKAFNGTNDVMTFATGASERMRIDSSGNVGIGASSINANNRLQITGQTSDTDGTGLDQGQLFISDTDQSASSGLLVGYRYNTGVAEYGRIQARNSAGATNLALQVGGGNVGIGTSSTTSKLGVVDSGTGANTVLVQSGQTGTTTRSNTVLRLQTTATGRDVNIQLSDNVTNSAEIGMVGGPMYFATGGVERMRIDSSGNVGIGTSSPSYQLTQYTTSRTRHVLQGATANAGTQGADTTWYDGTTAHSLGFQQSLFGSGGSTLSMVAGNSQAMNFVTSNTERMRITQNGGVSFGSSGTAYGSSGQVLVSNGDTTPTWGSAIVSGTAQATTSGTTKDFTSIPSWVKRITIVLDGVSLSGTANTIIQVGNGSVVTSGYNYYWSATQGSGLAVYNSTNGFSADGGNGSIIQYGTIVLTNISGNKWVATGLGGAINTTLFRSWQGGGDISLGGTLDRIRITSSNGTDTFDAGSVNILYE